MIPVIYEDEHMVVVSKPGGLLVHRSRESTDSTFLLQMVRDQMGGQWLYPAHRLDRACSGIVVFARSSQDAKLVQQAMNGPDTKKFYLAVTRGKIPRKLEMNRPLTNRETGRKQEARTGFERIRLMKIDDTHYASLVRARLYTGRRHQIRRHLSHAGNFILGDTTYGKGHINKVYRERYALPRLCLHAAQLEMKHPVSGDELMLTDPLPEDLRDFMVLLPGLEQGVLDCL